MALPRTTTHDETHRLEHVRLYRDELEQIIRAVAEIGEATVEGPGSANEISPTQQCRNVWTGWRSPQELASSSCGSSSVGRTPSPEITDPNTLVLGVLNRVVGICQRKVRRWGGGWRLGSVVVPPHVQTASQPTFSRPSRARG